MSPRHWRRSLQALSREMLSRKALSPGYWRRRWNGLSRHEQFSALKKLDLILIIALALAGVITLFQASHTVSQFRHPTLIYDQAGNPWFNLHDPLGTHLKLSQMPPYVARAVIAVEDRRFYRHGFFDIRGVLRAVWQNLKAAGIREGASTLTQQLARTVFLTHRRTLSRKLQEAVFAAELETQFSKDEILEAYLNRIFMGGSLYGMPAAARYFFGKDITRVSIAEAATLAAIIRSPNLYNPKVNPDGLLDRRNTVLKRMLEQQHITRRQYDQAIQEKLRFVRVHTVDRTETYFKEFVRSELTDLLGEEILDEYGYRIYSSFSPQLQSLAESAANQEMARLEASKALYKYPDQPQLQVALVSIETDTGHINAMVGGRNYGGSQYNHVTQALRQPGSAFKPILYATALSRGYTPASSIDLPPVAPPGIEETSEVKPEGPSSITLREALTKSINAAAYALIAKVGKSQTIELAQRLGIRSQLPEVESLALGAGEVRVLELTAAYMAFPSGGQVIAPHSIARVEDNNGRVLYQEKPEPKRVLSAEVAYQMTSMLTDVVARGTAAGYATAAMPFPVGGKTGTTNGYKDAWFVGFSPKIVCGVWIGHDNPRPTMPAGYGARLALPIWGRYMRGTTRLIKHGNFAIPATLRGFTLCRVSGQLATDECNHILRPDGTAYSAVYTEYLIPGSEPTQPCPVHAEGSGGGNLWDRMRRLFHSIIPAPP